MGHGCRFGRQSILTVSVDVGNREARFAMSIVTSMTLEEVDTVEPLMLSV